MKKQLLFFFMFFIHIVYSQENNTEHLVVKGETLFGIARKYNTTVTDIINANPSTASGLKENYILTIPKSEKTFQNASPLANNDQNNFVHIVKAKETKFGLSKIYGISIQELEARNPQIVAGLQVGHQLQIPSSTKKNVQNSTTAASSLVNSSFNYVVLPGETLYGIARRNKITVGALREMNKSVLDGILKSGQRLMTRSNNDQVLNDLTGAKSENINYHIVAARETKYGLSKKYMVTIAQLENLNPQIIKGLQTGQKLVIPELNTKNNIEANNLTNSTVISGKSEVQTTVFRDEDYFDYQIQLKETLFGLSKKAGMTVKDFVILNPKLVTVFQVGMLVKIPKSASKFFEVEIANTGKEIIKNNAEPIKTKSKPDKNDYYLNTNLKNLTTTLKKTVKKKLAIVLPFSATKYKEVLAKSSNFSTVNNDFDRKNLEFYAGALKAIDSSKRLGLSFDVKIIQGQTNLSEPIVNDLNKNNAIQEADAVILPFYDLQATKLAGLLNTKNTPIITAQALNSTKGLSNLYVLMPSELIVRNAILEYLKSKNAALIVISSANRSANKNYIIQNYPEAKFVKISSRNVVDTDDLKKLLVKGKLNYVILDADKSSVIISSTNVLLNELADFQVQIVVLDHNLLNNYASISSIRLNLLKMIYPSFNSVEKIKQLDMTVKKIFKINPEEISQNFMFGFDSTLDILLRLSQDRDFEKVAKEDTTEYIKFKFSYKKDSFGKNINQGFYILQHDTDDEFKVLKN